MSEIMDAKALFAGGRWATERMLAAMNAGRALNAGILRTLDTLRTDEWRYIDTALISEATIRLVGVADLIGAGLTKPVPNALGRLVFGYEKVTDMDGAAVSLDGLARTDNDRQEFQLNQMPLPVIHKDFFINLRTLAASRNSGEPLDTTQIRTAGRVVSEKAEYMLFNGGPTFGGMPIYGYLTHPDRIYSQYGNTNQPWSDSGKTGEEMKDDVLYALTRLQAQRQYGPFFVYVSTNIGVRLDDDFKANSDKTIRQRLLEIEGIASIKTADQLPASTVVFVQKSLDTAAWVTGENLQTVQWDLYGGMQVNFKAMMIGVPLVRSDTSSRCGVFVFSTSGVAQ